MKIKNIFLFCLAMIAGQAYAFKLEPMVVDFTAQGESSTKVFRVENEGKERIAVKIQAFIRQIDSHGKEKRIPTDHFKIYPQQLSLNASDSRAIRVTYQGPKDLPREAAYRIVATQLPVSFKNKVKQSGISFLFQFVASVYVTSETFVPKIEVESVKRTDPDYLKINIVNKGLRHRQLKNVKIHLKDNNGQLLTLNDATIGDWSGENILSGGKRQFSFKTNRNFDLSKNSAVVEVKDEN